MNKLNALINRQFVQKKSQKHLFFVQIDDSSNYTKNCEKLRFFCANCII